MADRDATKHPNLEPSMCLDLGEIHAEQLDELAMVLFDWSPAYAYGEVSLRSLEGPDDAGS